MGKEKKATKKFQAKHLTKALAKRRLEKKIKTAAKVKAAKVAAREADQEEDATGGQEPLAYEDMSFDNFVATELGADEEEPEEPEEEESEGEAEAEAESSEEEAEDMDAAGDEDEGDESSEIDDPVTKQLQGENATMEDEVAEHKAMIARMQEKDPEFFAFMAKNDPNLLKFGEGDDEEPEEAEEGEAAAEADGSDEKDEEGDETVVITTAILDRWEKQIESNLTRKALRRFAIAFHCAVAGSDKEEEEHLPYSVATGSVFNKLMTFCMGKMDTYFDQYLGWRTGESAAEGAEGPKTRLPSGVPTWKKLASTVKMYLTALLRLLETAADADVSVVVTSHLSRLVPYLAVFPPLARKSLKSLLRLCAGGQGSVPVHAFLAVRDLAINIPYPFIDHCLKGIYMAYVRNSKFVNMKSLPVLTFLQNCVVELYGLDFVSSYQHAFVYIRQLAIHLRNALNTKSKASYQTVYNWQFLNCIKLWAHMLAVYSKEKEMMPLCYPLIQVIIGVARLVPSSRYYPLRFVCVRALNEIAEATGLYIPAGALLLEVLDCAELRKKPKPSTERPLDFRYNYKATKNGVHTKLYQDAVIDEALELLLHHYTIYGSSISFPELVFPATTKLRHFRKETKVPRFRSKATKLLSALTEQESWVRQQRDTVAFAPKDAEALEFLKGKKAPIAAHLARELKEKAARVALQRSDMDDGRKGKKGRDEEAEDDDDYADESDDDNGFGGADEEDGDDEVDEESDASGKAASKPGKGASQQNRKRRRDDAESDGQQQQPAKKKQKKKGSSAPLVAAGDEDIVGDLDLSESDD